MNSPHYTACPRQNHLLAALPDACYLRLAPHLEKVDMSLGQVLNESGITPAYAYFPTTSIVSLLYVAESGGSNEIAVVGYDGMVGIALFMGGGSSPGRAVVQSTGYGFRLKANVMKAEFARAESVMHVMLCYTQALINQMSQAAVCSRYHTLEQRLSRRLLLSLDRTHGMELALTHELIANLLGVRREGVTEAALQLQNDGLIRYARGRITVLDRLGLEKRACECYDAVRREFKPLSALHNEN